MGPIEKTTRNRSLKLYHGIIALMIAALILYVIAPFIGNYIGISANMLGELLLLATAVLIPVVAKVDLRNVFPLAVPTLEGTIGTLLIYSAAQAGIFVVAMVLSRFFPQAVNEAGQGVGQLIVSLPALAAMIMIIVLPSICEEAIFRGVFLNSLRGSIRNKWIIILLTGIIFGIFHGSVVRAVPTAIGGIVLGYLMLETGNLFYSMMYHFLNNMMSVLPLLLLQALYNLLGGGSVMQVYDTAGTMRIPLLTIGIYLLYAAVIPFGLYAGNYLLHIGKLGYEKPLFAKEHMTTYLILGIATVAIVMAGILTIVFSVVMESDLLRSMVRIAG